MQPSFAQMFLSLVHLVKMAAGAQKVVGMGHVAGSSWVKWWALPPLACWPLPHSAPEYWPRKQILRNAQ